VEAGGHFNTLMGYRDSSAGFFGYTADPLDGWGRPFYGRPMRWKKMRVTDSTFRAGVPRGSVASSQRPESFIFSLPLLSYLAQD
jgi:hypothetical protein